MANPLTLIIGGTEMELLLIILVVLAVVGLRPKDEFAEMRRFKREREALRSIRSHRLLEAFLVTVMGFGWEEVHIYAHRLEQAIDERFEDRMDELAGYPQRCPHGDPIPSKDGKMPLVNDVSVLECAVGTAGVVRRIRNHTPEKLTYLEQLGLLPGAAVTLLGRAPFNGPVRLLTGGPEHVLGAELARDLLIEISAA